MAEGYLCTSPACAKERSGAVVLLRFGSATAAGIVTPRSSWTFPAITISFRRSI